MLYRHCLGMWHYILELFSSGTTERRHTQLFLFPPHAQIHFIFCLLLILFYFNPSFQCTRYEIYCLPVLACLSACLCSMPEWSGTCGPLLTSFEETFCLNVSVTEAVSIADFESHLFFCFPSPSYCDINRFDAISRPVPNKIYIFSLQSFFKIIYYFCQYMPHLSNNYSKQSDRVLVLLSWRWGLFSFFNSSHQTGPRPPGWKALAVCTS